MTGVKLMEVGMGSWTLLAPPQPSVICRDPLKEDIPASKDIHHIHHLVRHQMICPVSMVLLLNVWFLGWQGASLIFVLDQASMRMLDFLQEVYRLLYCIDNPVFQPSLIANRLFPVCVAIQTDTDRRLTCRLLKCKRL